MTGSARKIVFVVGAGASNEVDLPTGPALKEEVFSDRTFFVCSRASKGHLIFYVPKILRLSCGRIVTRVRFESRHAVYGPVAQSDRAPPC